MTRRERLPEPTAGCRTCRSGIVSARNARAEAIRTKRLHAKHALDGWAERYRDEALTAKTMANDSDARYFVHHAEAHPLPAVVLPATFNDKAPSHRKPPMPVGAELAARLRDGETLADLAIEYQRTPDVLRRKISYAGFVGTTGEQRTDRRRDADGLPVLPREWSFPEWVDEALCAQVGGDLWFPEKGRPGSTVREAKAICGRCPVRATCLEEALLNDERYGIRGGFSERERRKLKKAVS